MTSDEGEPSHFLVDKQPRGGRMRVAAATKRFSAWGLEIITTHGPRLPDPAPTHSIGFADKLALRGREPRPTDRRPEWAVYQLTVFSQRARSQPAERKEVAAAHEEFEQKIMKETKGVVCHSRPEAGVNSVSVD